MISLTRLSGKAFLLNADLIERVDCTPDTVVTLVDGTKYLVAEPLDTVHDAVVSYRAAIVARASLPEAVHVVPLRDRTTHLAAVRDDVDGPDRQPDRQDRLPDRHRGGTS